MRDTLPEDMGRFREIEQSFRAVCLGWGYEEVRTPTLEHLHLFTSAGTLSPQMLERVYSFLDWDGWSGERVVLRPDSTIPVARLYVENLSSAAIQRLFYVQNVLRFAEGDASREDWQCGVELIGDAQPLGDVELIQIAGEVLAALGVEASPKLSDPGILRAILDGAGFTHAEQLTLYDRVLDGEPSVLEAAAGRLPAAGASLQSLLMLEGDGPAFLRNLQSSILPAVPALERPLSELLAVSQTLADIGRKHSVAPLLVRNFEYYTGPVFHFYSGNEKVGGGGRYDSLIGLVGGHDTPASGFALDMEVLATLTHEPPISAARRLVVRPAGHSRAEVAAAFQLAGALRQAGRRFRLALSSDAGAERQVIAGRDGYTLALNGAGPRQFRTADEVLQALAESPQ